MVVWTGTACSPSHLRDYHCQGEPCKQEPPVALSPLDIHTPCHRCWQGSGHSPQIPEGNCQCSGPCSQEQPVPPPPSVSSPLPKAQQTGTGYMHCWLHHPAWSTCRSYLCTSTIHGIMGGKHGGNRQQISKPKAALTSKTYKLNTKPSQATQGQFHMQITLQDHSRLKEDSKGSRRNNKELVLREHPPIRLWAYFFTEMLQASQKRVAWYIQISTLDLSQKPEKWYVQISKREKFSG